MKKNRVEITPYISSRKPIYIYQKKLTNDLELLISRTRSLGESLSNRTSNLYQLASFIYSVRSSRRLKTIPESYPGYTRENATNLVLQVNIMQN